MMYSTVALHAMYVSGRYPGQNGGLQDTHYAGRGAEFH